MSCILTDSTVFNVGAQALVNTVNTYGVMGAGLALEFSLRYPKMFKEYEEQCKAGEIKVGKVYYYPDQPDGTIAINFPTKMHYAAPSKIEWIDQGLIDFIKTYQNHGITSVAFPKLGAANGKLDWGLVLDHMKYYLDPLDIDVYICSAEKAEPEGVEAAMVADYNAFISEPKNKGILKIKPDQEYAVFKNGPIKRFYEIRDIASIRGAKNGPYRKIFRKFYDPYSTSFKLHYMTEGNGQQSLFDDV